MHNLSKRQGALLVFLCTALFFLALALTLNQIKEPIVYTASSNNPTPLGYTFSLSLFFVPSLALLIWFVKSPMDKVVTKAFLITLILLTGLGFFLDILFASQFFLFENKAATLGIWIPIRGGQVPIEEFAFYFLGFLFMLLFYIWLDELWLAHYNTDYKKSCPRLHHIRGFHWASLWIALVLFLIASLFRNTMSELNPGIPWYFTYLLIAALIPSIGFYKTARRYINWRALFMTTVCMLLISLLWEVTLAMPYQWWGFNPDMMIGVFIAPWHRLPIEEVFLWVIAVYTTVIVFETVKICLSSGKSFSQVMRGD